MNEERIREEIAKWLRKYIKDYGVMNDWEQTLTVNPNHFEQRAEQILSIKGIRIEADNQDLPEIPPEHQRRRGIESVYDDGWRDGFEWLLNMLKDGWVKCKVKEEQK